MKGIVQKIVKYAKVDLVQDIALCRIGVAVKTLMVELVQLIVQAAQVHFTYHWFKRYNWKLNLLEIFLRLNMSDYK